MLCKEYKSEKQRALCYLTEGWSNWDKVIHKGLKLRKLNKQGGNNKDGKMLQM